MFNPFPGLRPFEPEEDHLFFGREKEIDELLRRLRTTRFLPVIGTSGSGKSSLVRSGLIPALYSGFMAKAGSSWRVAKFRPGEDPITNLASCLKAPDVLGTDSELADTNQILLETTLHRSTLGLVDAVHHARLPSHDNILIVVDQFEELFRFRHTRQMEHPKDEASAFVKLLLEAAQQNEFRIYIVLTMRADFIGDCMEYAGLPEAVNAGQYLIPRMTRDQLRSAITGPVAVAGGQIAQRLVLRLLNDLGDDQDQLPVLQHALMRTWDYWEQHRQGDEPLDIAHYEAVGTLRQALSLHAEEAYQDAGSDRGRKLAETIFKALTDTFSDSRGVRCPTSVQQLSAICEAPESDVTEVIDVFRRPGRCFLTPLTSSLGPRSIIDISHESLMRCWTRLMEWAEEERVSAGFYMRLSQAAAWYEEGTAGLWRDPELELSLQWRAKYRPSSAWAARYNADFARAMAFLDQSEKQRNQLIAEQERERRKKLRNVQLVAVVLAALLVATGWLAYIARQENARAEGNLQLAENAVDEMLASAGRDDARVAEDVPQMEEFRRELLEKARSFYAIFTTQKPDSERLRHETATAHFRLGDINRILQKPVEAAGEYREAIASFEQLAKDYPGNRVYRQSLANSYNWLGEILRTQTSTAGQADNAYQNALRLQEELVRESPADGQYVRELARTHYNRGILRYDTQGPKDAGSDFREAILLLGRSSDSQELSRAYNNLGNALRAENRLSEAKENYDKAIDIHERLLKNDPDNREYKQELATFHNNLAILLLDTDDAGLAEEKNRRALDLFEELARPTLSVGFELVNVHNLRCLMLKSQAECQQALNMLNQLAKVPGTRERPEFQRLSGDLSRILEYIPKRQDK
jgi:tetratricopeptide (TPR) repeat protein